MFDVVVVFVVVVLVVVVIVVVAVVTIVVLVLGVVVGVFVTNISKHSFFETAMLPANTKSLYLYK